MLRHLHHANVRRTAVMAFFVGAAFHAAMSCAQEQPSKLNATLKFGIEGIRSTNHFRKAWFRLERPGEDPIEVATAGAKTSDLVDIASVSKSVTAIAIAVLIQQGKLELQSNLGDLLPAYLSKRGTSLDPSLRPMTVQRLLTHRAGLRTNWTSDPVNGISTYKVTDQTGGSAHFLNYMIKANAGKSNGSDKYVYSNISYLLLGAVIEAISGQSYQDFCQENIMRPKGIARATIPSMLNVVAPFGGWRMEMSDILKIWSIFDIRDPTVLTSTTLKRVLLGKLGGPTTPDGDLYYTMGAYLRQDDDAESYVLNHNGTSTFIRGAPSFLTYVEKFVPGHAWVIVAAPSPEHNFRAVSRAVATQVRQMVKGALDVR